LTSRNAVSAEKGRNRTVNDECQQPLVPHFTLLTDPVENPNADAGVITGFCCFSVSPPSAAVNHGQGEPWMFSQYCDNISRNLLISRSFPVWSANRF